MVAINTDFDTSQVAAFFPVAVRTGVEEVDEGDVGYEAPAGSIGSRPRSPTASSCACGSRPRT